MTGSVFILNVVAASSVKYTPKNRIRVREFEFALYQKGPCAIWICVK
jgi:hypothetical protein